MGVPELSGRLGQKPITWEDFCRKLHENERKGTFLVPQLIMNKKSFQSRANRALVQVNKFEQVWGREFPPIDKFEKIWGGGPMWWGEGLGHSWGVGSSQQNKFEIGRISLWSLVRFFWTCDGFSDFNLQLECISVGSVPPTYWPYPPGCRPPLMQTPWMQ